MGELKSGWRRVKFGDVVRQVKDKVPAKESGLSRYIAGEHMDTNDLRLRRWGEINDDYLGPAFHIRFRPGQVLYGSRRTYLRKVAVAGFDGVCANTTFVVESKSPGILLPELLPFIMTTEAFHEHSVRESKGSVNPYVNFSDLAWYEFALPPLEEQGKISRILQRSAELQASYADLVQVAKTTHRSFVDQTLGYGAQRPCFEKEPPSIRRGWAYQPIEALCEALVDCLHRTPKYSKAGFPAIRTADVEPGFLRWETARRVPESEYLIQTTRLRPKPGDVLFSREGERMGMAALVPEGVSLCISQRMMHLRPKPNFPANLLMEYLNSSWAQRQILMHKSGSTSPHINVADVRRLMVPVPPRPLWPRFSDDCAELLASVAQAESRSVRATEVCVAVREDLLARANA
ncbi:Restriction modification system, type I [Plesiocystis pacifica SIR-1]|uniref:Restriction modification system, type I n=1 Tax=Plesiocystis pacifica SIR-1 TaxID=391625 RepID=A6G8I8_9BACT|nr:restriction endonuclease subunit S [Plesiocystis pacifica]EDM77765.1 Restriction modification system, type I [Plesiocystis pacifica SIR-1]